MRNCALFFMAAFTVLIFSACSSPSSALKSGEGAQEAALKKAVENRKFVVNVNRMAPMNGGTRHLSSPYSLAIDGDKVKSHLPYFGTAYSVPYGGGKGLVFDSLITGYKSSWDEGKKKTWVEFTTKTNEDSFVYRLEIFPNGSSSIQVTSVNRQNISFYGTAEAAE